jgi:hypothetical protein
LSSIYYEALTDHQNTTSPLSSLTAMLLSNLTSHPNLVAHIASLKIPVIPLPLSKTYPPYFLPASLSATSTIHPDFRDPTIGSANKEAGQEEEREVEGLRAMVLAMVSRIQRERERGNVISLPLYLLISQWYAQSFCPRENQLISRPRH